MKLKFHGEVPTVGASYSGYHGRGAANAGVDMAFVFENPPQRRTIIAYGGPKTYWLPYIIFVIRYKKQSQGCWYGGVYYSGLCVSFRNEPLESIDDVLCQSPTDPGGYVCTDHRFDNMVCGSAEEVAGTVLDIWWNSTHAIGYNHPSYMPPNGGNWEAMTEENVTQQPWNKSGYTIRTLLGIQAKKVKLLDEEVGELPSRFFKVAR